MQITNLNISCPECKTVDCCQYVFVQHITQNEWDINVVDVSSENPSDEHFLYVCPKGHIFTGQYPRVVAKIT
jgi:hypothetical protein